MASAASSRSGEGVIVHDAVSSREVIRHHAAGSGVLPTPGQPGWLCCLSLSQRPHTQHEGGCALPLLRLRRGRGCDRLRCPAPWDGREARCGKAGCGFSYPIRENRTQAHAGEFCQERSAAVPAAGSTMLSGAVGLPEPAPAVGGRLCAPAGGRSLASAVCGSLAEERPHRILAGCAAERIHCGAGSVDPGIRRGGEDD